MSQPTHKAGGRPAAQPAPMTLAEWIAAGHPPLLLSVMQVAEWTNLSRVRVNGLVKKGCLFRYPENHPNKSKIPTDHPGNREWLVDRVGSERVELHSGGRPPGTPSSNRLPSIYDPPPGSAVPPPPPPSDMLDLDVVLDAISRMDLSKLPSAAVQKVQRLEAALKIRVEREAKRGLLIERALVTTVFARLYQVDTNELRTIGAKVAPDVAAELGVEDPETQLRIEKRIDDEVLKTLAHIKRLLDDFLLSVGAEQVAP